MTRYPWQALEPLPVNLSELARRIGVDPPQLHRWRKSGIPEDAADRIALALGKHPAMIWPAWAADTLAAAYLDCGSRATSVRHRRHGEQPCPVCLYAEREYWASKYRRMMSDPIKAGRERERNRERMRISRRRVSGER